MKLSLHRPSGRRGPTTVGAVLAATLLLSSCSGTPGAAAEVQGDTISASQVDNFAQVLCHVGAVQPTQAGTPTRSVRLRSLQILLDDELAAHMASGQPVDKKILDSILTQMESARSNVPPSLRATYDSVAEQFARAQTAVIAVGRASLEKQGQTASQITNNAAYTEGERLRTKYAASADVSVDPRYGTMVNGTLKASDGSLSVPVSEIARKGAASAVQPDATFVGQLPASQKCS